MASLSISDAPLHSSSRKGGLAYSGIHPSGSVRISPTHSTGTAGSSSNSSGGGGAEIDGIDPERADILASHSHDDVMLHEEDDEGVVLTDDFGGSPHKERKGSSASVWKTYLCKYRYVFAGVLILVTASLIAGIAIGASKSKRSGGGQAAGAAATTQTDGADKGGYDLDLNVPTPPDEPTEGASSQPQHGDHGALNPQDGAGAAPVDTSAQGSGGRGDSGDSGSQTGRGSTGDSADGRTKNKKTGGFKPSTGTGTNESTASTGGNEAARDKTKVGGAVGGGGGQKSLSYSQRNRRALLGNLHKIKAAKDNRNSAAKTHQRHHQRVQKKWRGGTLEGDEDH